MKFPTEVQLTLADLIIRRVKAVIPFMGNASKEVMFFESTSRFAAVLSESGDAYLSFSVSKNEQITLHSLNIGLSKRGNGHAKTIIEILKKHQQLTEESGAAQRSIIVKYPENKEFWYYYSTKYGGIEFQYQ